MSEIVRKRRLPTGKETFKSLRTDINQIRETFEYISKQLLQVVEYITMTEIRIQQLECLMDNQATTIKELQQRQSPDLPYIPWSNENSRDEFVSPLELSESESDLNVDLLSFGDEDHQLLHMSPLSLEEHPGTILNLLCNEVMD